MRKLILSNRQSPGDIVMLTAAVRDLHRSHPGKFATDVRTSGGALWENNPHLTPLRDDDAEAERVASARRPHFWTQPANQLPGFSGV